MKNKILVILTLLAGVILFQSCLKDNADYWPAGVAGKMYATVFSPGFHSNSVQPIADEVTFTFMVNIASDAVPKTATTVNLAFDNAAIAAYNATLKAAAFEESAWAASKSSGDTAANGDPIYKIYSPFPSATLITPTVTIAAGARTGIASFKVARADTVQLSGNYMLAVSIQSVSPATIMTTANMKSYLVALPIANQFEGTYSNDGYFRHPTAASSRALDNDKELLTVNKNTCELGLADLADPATGAYFIKITVQDETIVVGGKTVNKVTIVNSNPSVGPAVVAQLDTSDDLLTFDQGVTFNYYDPSSKKFVLRYHYNNGAAWREIMEVLTKK